MRGWLPGGRRLLGNRPSPLMRLPAGLIAGLALLAFALQTSGLGQPSLWYDEGFSVWLAQQPLSEIVRRTAADIHPPLFYLLLHPWLALAGSSEFALRFPSVCAAVLAVPLIWQVARRLFQGVAAHRTVAGVAATLVALSPLWLWYAREARMYTLLTSLGLAALALALQRRGDDWHPRHLLTLTLLNIAIVYTHFYGWFLVAVQGVWLLTSLASRRLKPQEGSEQPAHPPSGPRRHAVRALAWSLLPLALTLLAYLPWMGFVAQRLSQDRSYWDGALPIPYVLTTLLGSWSSGHALPPALADPIGWLYGVLWLAGLGVLLWQRHWWAALALASTLLVPLCGLLGVSFGRPKYHPRYLMLAAPGFILGISVLVGTLLRARGWLGRASGALVLGGLLVVSGVSAWNTHFDGRFARDDWRRVAATILAQGPADPVLLLSGHSFPVLRYYAPDIHLIPLPDAPTLDTSQVIGYADAPALADALTGATALWLVRWQDEVVDPDDVTGHLLAHAGGQQLTRDRFFGLTLERWALPPEARFPTAPTPVQPQTLRLRNGLTFLGADGPQQAAPADQGITLTLFWQAEQPLPDDLKVRLSVHDERGTEWGGLDRRVASYLHPTFRWRPNDPRPVQVTLPLLAGTPSGEYEVSATVYTDGDPAGVDILDAAGAPAGRRIRVGRFPVAPAEDGWQQSTLPVEAMPLSTGALVGAAFAPPLAQRPYEGGERISVRLWLRGQDDGLPPTIIPHWKQDGAPVALGEAITLTEQAPGSLRLFQPTLRIPPELPAGTVALHLAVGDELSPPLATLDLVATTRRFDPPPMAYAQSATFGEGIRLVGYDLAEPRPGEALAVTVHWQALAPTLPAQTAFVHLLAPDGRFLAGADTAPPRPTDSWVADEYLSQPFSFPLPAALPPGRYQLEVGWYDPAAPSYPRLPVEGSGAEAAARRVILQTPVIIE